MTSDLEYTLRVPLMCLYEGEGLICEILVVF